METFSIDDAATYPREDWLLRFVVALLTFACALPLSLLWLF